MSKEKYKTTPASEETWDFKRCETIIGPFSSLDTIYHVTHIPNSFEILNQGIVRAGLVFDQSILNKSRILVSWLSPNSWEIEGYRYGNIKWEFKWSELIKGRKLYRVEKIAYSPPAYRFLLSSQNCTSLLNANKIVAYDPKTESGPIQFNTKTKEYMWYSSFDICIEIMLQDDLTIDAGNTLSFVEHHKNQCSIDHHTCKYKGTKGYEAAALFFAGFLSMDVSRDQLGIQIDVNKEEDGRPSQFLYMLECFDVFFSRSIQGIKYRGIISNSDPASLAITKGMLFLYYNRRLDLLKKAASLFANENDLFQCVVQLIIDEVEIKIKGKPDEILFHDRFVPVEVP